MLAHLYPHRPIILGHRGASADAPENTLAAFRLALAQGADGVELDVTLSSDGVPVVIHDDTVDRTTNGTGRVATRTLAQLKQLDAGYATKFGGKFAGERIPTLAEALAELGQRAFINIELKRDPSPDQGLAQRVVALIHDQQVSERVLLSSVYYANLQRVKALDATLPVGLLYDPSAPARMMRAWLTPGVRAEAHHPHHSLFNAVTRGAYRARGLRVNVWTVNAEADLRRLMRLGVDGIITDKPEFVIRLLRRAD